MEPVGCQAIIKNRMSMTNNEFIENIAVLKSEYPKWKAPVVTLIAVHSNDAFKVLISTIISLRTKDEVTAKASERLFQVGSDPEKIGALEVEKIEKLIYPAGFYKRKAAQIKNICLELVTSYNSRVPDTREKLMSFKGVGRKTANLVLSLGFNKDAICVDTHVHRISNRWGIVTTKNPELTEFALMDRIPEKYWREINDLMVAFGQTICRPVGPKCSSCPVKFCESGKNEVISEK